MLRAVEATRWAIGAFAVPEGRWNVSRLCLAFADGQGFAFEVSEENDGNEKDVLGAWFRMMRGAIGRVVKSISGSPVVRFGNLTETLAWGTARDLHDGLRETCPIRVEAGFEGNPGVEGGAWRPSDRGDDGVVHLRFAAGTEDLPLHVHEFSDRLLVVTSGLGLFHYLPDGEKSRELRSVVVGAGDAVLFMRGVVHTFTAPLDDLTLLSYHAPFFEFNDPRQYSLAAMEGLPRALLNSLTRVAHSANAIRT
jgi:mannose-6-phosphate isomerase-like protein (cupin superfamily)